MTEFLLDTYPIRILASIGMLSIACSLDLSKREIHDALWVVFGVIAVLLIFIEPDFETILIEIGFALIIAPIVLILWRFGLFGGADALGLIVLSALAPQITFSSNFVTPFTTLTNAALVSTVILLVNLINNLFDILNHRNIFEGFSETRFRKVCAVFLGYRTRNPRYSFTIEKPSGTDKKFDFSLHDAENDEFCKTPDTWVSPGIPFIIYITGGIVIQLFYGDIILNPLMSFMGLV